MKSGARSLARFRRKVWVYYRRHGRDFAWRRTQNPYRILVSEVMLQQTQVARVAKKYPEFVRAFPNFRALARASLRRVLEVWRGMGYNRRAIALHRIAREVEARFQGCLPQDSRALESLPGIGSATAASIAAFAFNLPAVFVETNIRRAFIDEFFAGRRNVKDAEIKTLLIKTISKARPRAWYFALMDYGAMLGRVKKENPNRRSVAYRPQSPFRGSRRELRGQIVARLLRKSAAPQELARTLARPRAAVEEALRDLEREGFLFRKKGRYFVP